jgi:hypothetical protein
LYIEKQFACAVNGPLQTNEFPRFENGLPFTLFLGVQSLTINADFENAGDFFLLANYFMGHFEGYFEGVKTFLTL